MATFGQTRSEESTLEDTDIFAELMDWELKKLAARRNEENANTSLKNSSVLPAVKEKIETARKPRLRVVEQFMCDCCDDVISQPLDGFLIHGNIYVADPKELGGLIGNNFPESGKIEDVKKTVLCKGCFRKALGLLSKDDVSPKLTTMINRRR